MLNEEDKPLMIDEYEAVEAAVETDLAVAERLLAELLIRAWRNSGGGASARPRNELRHKKPLELA